MTTATSPDLGELLARLEVPSARYVVVVRSGDPAKGIVAVINIGAISDDPAATRATPITLPEAKLLLANGAENLTELSAD